MGKSVRNDDYDHAYLSIDFSRYRLDKNNIPSSPSISLFCFFFMFCINYQFRNWKTTGIDNLGLFRFGLGFGGAWVWMG